MKIFISIIVGCLFFVSPLCAQRIYTGGTSKKESEKKTEKQQNKKTSEDVIRNVLPRDKMMMDNSLDKHSSANWYRDVYREVAIVDGENAVFFYPAKSTEEQANLFSLLFNLVNDGKIHAYKFDLVGNQGKKNLDQIVLKDVFDSNSIPYKKGNKGTLIVDPYYLPTENIKSYYVREKWVFDEKTARSDVRVVAICPVLHQMVNLESDIPEEIKTPLFWVSFEDMSNYLFRASNNISTGEMTKTSPDLTFFEILRSRHYKGDIYQIGDRVLAIYCDTPEEMKEEQERLDQELKSLQTRFNRIR